MIACRSRPTRANGHHSNRPTAHSSDSIPSTESVSLRTSPISPPKNRSIGQTSAAPNSASRWPIPRIRLRREWNKVFRRVI